MFEIVRCWILTWSSQYYVASEVGALAGLNSAVEVGDLAGLWWPPVGVEVVDCHLASRRWPPVGVKMVCSSFLCIPSDLFIKVSWRILVFIASDLFIIKSDGGYRV